MKVEVGLEVEWVAGENRIKVEVEDELGKSDSLQGPSNSPVGS